MLGSNRDLVLLPAALTLAGCLMIVDVSMAMDACYIQIRL
jgi:hypothetical protein